MDAVCRVTFQSFLMCKLWTNETTKGAPPKLSRVDTLLVELIACLAQRICEQDCLLLVPGTLQLQAGERKLHLMEGLMSMSL